MLLWGHLIGRWLVPRRYAWFSEAIDRAQLHASDPASAEEHYQALLEATIRLGRACRRSYSAGVGFAEAVQSWVRLGELARVTGEIADSAHRRAGGPGGGRDEARRRARALHFAHISAERLRPRAMDAFGYSHLGMSPPSSDDSSPESIRAFGEHCIAVHRVKRWAILAQCIAASVLFALLTDLLIPDTSWPWLYAAGCALFAAAHLLARAFNRRLSAPMPFTSVVGTHWRRATSVNAVTYTALHSSLDAAGGFDGGSFE